jgi:ribosomal protein S19
MGRSLKKGPFVDTPLRNSVEALNARNEKKDVVPSLHHCSGDDRPHDRRA